MTQWGLDNLFNPGKRHMDDEKRRLQSTREEVGDNSGGRRIDLEGGKVSISVPRRAVVETESTTGPDVEAEVLEPALEAEDVPAIALASDEAEIAPELVDDAAVEPEETAVERDPTVEPAAETEPVAESAPEPVATATPTPATARRRVSAKAWSRGG